jgi:hypothetical protein
MAPFEYKPGGDSQDIVRGGGRYVYEWECPKCKWKGENPGQLSQFDRLLLNPKEPLGPSDPYLMYVCPNCKAPLDSNCRKKVYVPDASTTLLLEKMDDKRRRDHKIARQLLFVNVALGAAFLLSGVVLSGYFGLIGVLAALMLGVLTLGLARYSWGKVRYGYGNIRPYKYGYLFTFGIGILLLILAVISYL